MKAVLDFLLGGRGQPTTLRVLSVTTGIWIVATGVFLAIPSAAPYALFPTRAYLAVVYVFLLFRLAGWVRRNVALLQERFRDKGIRGIFRRRSIPTLSEEDISKNIRVTRGIWLAVGLAALLIAMRESALVALFSFTIGLMLAALVSCPPRNGRERAAWAGKAIFVMALTIYVFYGVDTNGGLLSLLAGITSGYATFLDENHSIWQVPYRKDRWSLLKRELRAIAEKIRLPGNKP